MNTAYVERLEEVWLFNLRLKSYTEIWGKLQMSKIFPCSAFSTSAEYRVGTMILSCIIKDVGHQWHSSHSYMQKSLGNRLKHSNASVLPKTNKSLEVTAEH